MLEQSNIAAPEESANWQSWILYDAHRLRNNLVAHREGPRLCVSYHQSIELSHSFTLFNKMSGAGFTEIDTAYSVSTVVNYVIGFTLEETSSAAPKDRAASDLEFDYGLRLLLAGMEHQLANARRWSEINM